MSESLTLTTPVARNTTSYRVACLRLQRLPRPVIVVDVLSDQGEALTQIYEGETARTLLNALNTLNLTNNSLEKRILDRLASDGFLGAGSVSGTPGD